MTSVVRVPARQRHFHAINDLQPTSPRLAVSKEAEQLEQQFLLYDDSEALGGDHQVLSTQHAHLITLHIFQINICFQDSGPGCILISWQIQGSLFYLLDRNCSQFLLLAYCDPD